MSQSTSKVSLTHELPKLHSYKLSKVWTLINLIIQDPSRGNVVMMKGNSELNPWAPGDPDDVKPLEVYYFLVHNTVWYYWSGLLVILIYYWSGLIVIFLIERINFHCLHCLPVAKWCLWRLPCLVVVEDALGKGFVEHLAVPLLQSLGLGDLLVGGMAMEDVVVTLARGAGPDMCRHVPISNQVKDKVQNFIFKSLVQCLQFFFFFFFRPTTWRPQNCSPKFLDVFQIAD